MTPKIELEKIYELFKNESGNENAIIGSRILENETIFFHPGFNQETGRLASLYQLRLEIYREAQMKIGAAYNNSNDFEITVSALKKFSEPEARLSSFWSQGFLFLIFLPKDCERLIGIMRSSSQESLTSLEENYDNTIKKGLGVGAIKFEKMNLIKGWGKNA